MRILLSEQINPQDQLNIDIRMPYISGFLKEMSITALYIRYFSKHYLNKQIQKFRPDIIITNQISSVKNFNGEIILSQCFEEYFNNRFGTKYKIFYFLPDYDAIELEPSGKYHYIPHIVLSNSCNYSRSINENPLYKNIKLNIVAKKGGCTFCTDKDSDIRWQITDENKLVRLFSLATDYVRRRNTYSIRIVGEEFTKRPDIVFSILSQISRFDIKVIITIRPEILIENYRHFFKALKIASETNNYLILCSVGIESFYNNDLLLYNRYLDTIGVIKSISNIYKLKDRFFKPLILNRYELFNFIIFHPYTSIESIEYNIKMMITLGIKIINKQSFLNRLIIPNNSFIYHLTEKDRLITSKNHWRFKNKDVDRFYKRLSAINTDTYKTSEILQILRDYK